MRIYGKMTISSGPRCSLPLDSPVVVIGDRSQSMEVAVRTSTIIAALMAALADAKLVFFNSQNTDAPNIPRNMEEVSGQWGMGLLPDT